jgi:hypothetical protein
MLAVSMVTVLWLSMPMAQAFSTPLFEPVVITFGESEEVGITVQTLVQNYPKAKVFKYEEKKLFIQCSYFDAKLC